MGWSSKDPSWGPGPALVALMGPSSLIGSSTEGLVCAQLHLPGEGQEKM